MNHRKQRCVSDFIIPTTTKNNEIENLEKYLDLSRALKKLWKDISFGAFRTFLKILSKKKMKKNEIHEKVNPSR